MGAFGPGTDATYQAARDAQERASETPWMTQGELVPARLAATVPATWEEIMATRHAIIVSRSTAAARGNAAKVALLTDALGVVDAAADARFRIEYADAPPYGDGPLMLALPALAAPRDFYCAECGAPITEWSGEIRATDGSLILHGTNWSRDGAGWGAHWNAPLCATHSKLAAFWHMSEGQDPQFAIDDHIESCLEIGWDLAHRVTDFGRTDDQRDYAEGSLERQPAQLHLGCLHAAITCAT